jgi:hypothetical protein
MREVVFRVLVERAGHLEAQAQSLPIQITAPTHEDLQHEAREALMAHVGPTHCTYRIRICRSPGLLKQPGEERFPPSEQGPLTAQPTTSVAPAPASTEGSLGEQSHQQLMRRFIRGNMTILNSRCAGIA